MPFVTGTVTDTDTQGRMDLSHVWHHFGTYMIPASGDHHTDVGSGLKFDDELED